jgi:hypothetical protein
VVQVKKLEVIIYQTEDGQDKIVKGHGGTPCPRVQLFL